MLGSSNVYKEFVLNDRELLILRNAKCLYRITTYATYALAGIWFSVGSIVVFAELNIHGVPAIFIISSLISFLIVIAKTQEQNKQKDKKKKVKQSVKDDYVEYDQSEVDYSQPGIYPPND